jgi:chromosome segregation ATPase
LDHEKLLEDERNRANESEIKLSIQAKIEEDKVASLEQKLSELSDIIGKYDRQREQDQQVILKLKERVSQLDLENAALAKAHFQNNTATSNDMLDQLVILQEKVSKLRQLLKLATQKILTNSQLPTNLEGIGNINQVSSLSL